VFPLPRSQGHKQLHTKAF